MERPERKLPLGVLGTGCGWTHPAGPCTPADPKGHWSKERPTGSVGGQVPIEAWEEEQATAKSSHANEGRLMPQPE